MKVIYKEHCGVEFRNIANPYFHSFFHIMAAIFDRFRQLRFCQGPVNIEGNCGFLDRMSHKGFQRLQADRRIGHHIIIDQGEIPEQTGKPVAGFIIKDDPVIHFLWVEPAQDTFQNELVIMAAVVPGPNGFLVALIEAL